jgi:hypothetical protein
VLALITLGIKTLLEWKQSREFERAQIVLPEPDETDTMFLARSASDKH